MKSKQLTDAELLLLGLVAEMPRHGYELEQVIEQRGMREWTQIGFSSIYFVLGKLEKIGLVTAEKQKGTKAKKVFVLTDLGRSELIAHSLTALSNTRPIYSSVLIGMAHWPVLQRAEALSALETRKHHIEAEILRVEGVLTDQQPLPEYVEAIFDFGLGQLSAEAAWVERTLDYMKTKPWPENQGPT